MNIDPAVRANCKDFRIVCLRRFLFTLSAARRRRGRLLRVPAADGRTMQEVVSRIFRTFGLAERRPALAYAVMAPLI
jgi:hypothetical protein